MTGPTLFARLDGLKIDHDEEGRCRGVTALTDCPCSCGADAHNAEVDAIKAALREAAIEAAAGARWEASRTRYDARGVPAWHDALPQHAEAERVCVAEFVGGSLRERRIADHAALAVLRALGVEVPQ